MKQYKKGIDHWSWKGGKEYHYGYVKICAPDHPRVHKGKVYEHIIVMENRLGRYLLPSERIHHINHIKDDNRPENLELTNTHEHQSKHKGEHKSKHAIKYKTHSQKCIKCGSLDVVKSGGERRYRCNSCNTCFRFPFKTREQYTFERRLKNNVKCPTCNELCVKEGKNITKTKQMWKCKKCKKYFGRSL